MRESSQERRRSKATANVREKQLLNAIRKQIAEIKKIAIIARGRNVWVRRTCIFIPIRKLLIFHVA